MNQFIKVRSKRNGRLLIINTNQIKLVGIHDNGDTTIRLIDDDEYTVSEHINDVWDQLKPNIIFA